MVVESVERHIEDGLAPKEAALKAMEEISGPVIGIALVLSAVFVPTAFIPGITGQAVSTVRGHHRHLGDFVGVQCPVAEPRAGSSPFETEGGEQGSAGEIFCLVQPHVRTRHRRLRPAVGRAHPKERGGAASAGRRRRGQLFHQRQTAHQLRSRRGPGLFLPEHPAPQCRLAAANRTGGGENRGYSGEDAGRAVLHQRFWVSACSAWCEPATTRSSLSP